ncbi:hypothetical protein NBRC116188_12580 [Oceaniserpentilla sp. 4NH20-0058]|uniref:hypothetical protein n=1 Tax=Oceaniserpentilla sp. 4NH20-0058 TaxID=3127660 RepID=UPI0031041042
MSKCSKCDTNISFMSVLNTPNPLKVKCSGCKEPIHMDKVTGGIAVLIILAITIPVLINFYGSENYWLMIVLPVVAVAEVTYFLLIKFGMVKTKDAS